MKNVDSNKRKRKSSRDKSLGNIQAHLSPICTTSRKSTHNPIFVKYATETEGKRTGSSSSSHQAQQKERKARAHPRRSNLPTTPPPPPFLPLPIPVLPSPQTSILIRLLPALLPQQFTQPFPSFPLPRKKLLNFIRQRIFALFRFLAPILIKAIR